MTVRMLYAGSLRPGGNGLDRVAMFEAAGYEVVQADRFAFMQAGTRIERSIAARFQLGRAVRSFNRMLQARARVGGYDVVFVDKGVWVWPSTLRCLKSAAKDGLVIHYTPDAQFRENRSRYFFSGLPLYDLAVTTKSFEREAYRAAGARLHEAHSSGLWQSAVPCGDSGYTAASSLRGLLHWSLPATLRQSLRPPGSPCPSEDLGAKLDSIFSAV